MSVSAIVLAGGGSRRFGRDKLVEPIDGGTILGLTIAAVQAVASEVVVVLAPGSSVELPAGVRAAHDPAPEEGPLVGLAAGLDVIRHRAAVVVGGDMPWVQPVVLERMVSALVAGVAVVAIVADDRRQQLPLALDRDACRVVIRGLIGAGERRLGAMLDVAGVTTIAESEWRSLDPDALSLRDVDVPSDLPADR